MDINLAVLIVGSVTVIGLIQFLTWAVMIITHHNFDYLDPTLKLAARGGPVHDGPIISSVGAAAARTRIQSLRG